MSELLFFNSLVEESFTDIVALCSTILIFLIVIVVGFALAKKKLATRDIAYAGVAISLSFVLSFIKITQKIDKLEPYIKDYLSKTDTNGLVLYEEHVNQYEDLYYSYVEEFFDTTSVEKKKALLSSMKKCLTELKRAKYDSKEFPRRT